MVISRGGSIANIQHLPRIFHHLSYLTAILCKLRKHFSTLSFILDASQSSSHFFSSAEDFVWCKPLFLPSFVPRQILPFLNNIPSPLIPTTKCCLLIQVTSREIHLMFRLIIRCLCWPIVYSLTKCSTWHITQLFTMLYSANIFNHLAITRWPPMRCIQNIVCCMLYTEHCMCTTTLP